MKEKVVLLAIDAEGTPAAGEATGIGIHQNHGKRVWGERPPVESGAVRKPDVNFLKAFGEKLIGLKIHRESQPLRSLTKDWRNLDIRSVMFP